MKENYYYPAKMKFVDGNYQLRFIDFPDMLLIEEPTKEEDMGKELPEPDESETDVIYIQIWLPYYRNASKEIYVKKNVTIPQWLDILAKENKLSYSAALVNGLKHELGIAAKR